MNVVYIDDSSSEPRSSPLAYKSDQTKSAYSPMGRSPTQTSQAIPTILPQGHFFLKMQKIARSTCNRKKHVDHGVGRTINQKSESLASDSALPEYVDLLSPMHQDKDENTRSNTPSRKRKARSEIPGTTPVKNRVLSTLQNIQHERTEHDALYKLGMSRNGSDAFQSLMSSAPTSPMMLDVPSSGEKPMLNANFGDVDLFDNEGRTVSARRVAKGHSHTIQRENQSRDVQQNYTQKGQSWDDSAAGSSKRVVEYDLLMAEEETTTITDDVQQAVEDRTRKAEALRAHNRARLWGVYTSKSNHRPECEGSNDATTVPPPRRPSSPSMPIPGGPRPVNNLREPTVTPQFQKRHSSQVTRANVKSRTPDDGPASKRQRTSGPQVQIQVQLSSKVIDLEAQSSTTSQKNIGPFSSGHNDSFTTLSRNGTLDGKPSAYAVVESAVNPRSRSSRDRKSGQPAHHNDNVGGSRQFQKGSIMPKNGGEDPQDPIAEAEDGDELGTLTKSTTNSAADVRTSKYTGTANLRAPRPQGIMKQFGKQTNARKGETGETSPYFPAPSDRNEMNQSKTRRTKVAANKRDEFIESIDDLSKDFYLDPIQPKGIKKQHSSQVARNRDTSVMDADAEQSKVFQSVPDSSDDEDKRAEAAEIKPSQLDSAKRPKKRSGETQFTVAKVFSDQAIWYNDDRQALWTIVYDDAKRLYLFNADAGEIWEFSASAVTKIEYQADDNTKIILHKSQDIGSKNPIGKFIYLQFGQAKERQEFIGLLEANSPALGCVIAPGDRVQRTFDFQLDKRKSQRNTKQGRVIAQDIELIGLNATRKLGKLFDDAQQKKKLDNQLKVSQDAEGKSQSIATRMRSLENQEGGTGQRKELQHSPLKPENFYSPINIDADQAVTTRSTRTSDRKSIQRVPSRSPSPDLEKWSQQNPDWQKEQSWKTSLVYPREGVKKTTVDEQDIPRLDEGEFLNDNLIAFYLRWLEERLQKENPEFAKRVYFQNTFFYERLTRSPPKGEKINYDAVQRWTNKVNLLDFDYIVVPVNESSHWYVAIICNARSLLPNSSLSSRDERVLEGTHKTDEDGHSGDDRVSASVHEEELPVEASKSPPPAEHKDIKVETQGEGIEEHPIESDLLPNENKKSNTTYKKKKSKSVPPQRRFDTHAPRIILLDSLGLGHSPTAVNLKAYLVAEIKDKMNVEIEPPRAMGLTVKDIPLQDNFCDCGLYLLLYMEMFLSKGDNFIHSLLQGIRDVDLEWKSASQLRTSIRNLLFELQREQNKMNSDGRKKKLEKRTTPGHVRELSSTVQNTSSVSDTTPKMAQGVHGGGENSEHMQHTSVVSSTMKSPGAPIKEAMPENPGQTPKKGTEAVLASPGPIRSRPASQSDVIEIEDSQDVIETPEKHVRPPPISTKNDDLESRLGDFGRSFGPPIESPPPTTTLSVLIKTQTSKRDASVKKTPSPQQRKRQREASQNRPTETKRFPKRIRSNPDILESLEKTLTTGKPAAQKGRESITEVNMTDPVNVISPAEGSNMDRKDPQQELYDSEMLLQDSEGDRVQPGDRLAPIDLLESPQSTKGERKALGNDVERQQESAKRKRLKTYSNHERSSPVVSKQQLSVSPSSSSKKRKASSSGGFHSLDPMETVMLQLPRDPKRLRVVERSHTHFP